MKKSKIEFEARMKKIEIFSDTIQLILFQMGSLKDITDLYEIEQGKRIKVSISILND